MIRGSTALIAHIGYPTFTFKSPMIYNPYFEQAGIDTVVVPMACQAPQYPAFFKAVFSLDNICGALITMPHKVSTVALLDRLGHVVRVDSRLSGVFWFADHHAGRVALGGPAQLLTRAACD